MRHIEVFNLFTKQDWDAENDREGFRHLRTALGEWLGGRLLGGSLYELPPGERTADGERQLEPGDVAVFPEGPSGAHQVINRSGESCRVLILSSKAPVAIVYYPDGGKVGLWSQADGLKLVGDRPEPDYRHGET